MRTGARRAAWLVLAVLAVCLAWTAVVLLSVRDDLQDARGRLVELRSSGEPDALAPALADAERSLRDVAGRLQQPGPRVASWLPLVGRTPDAVRTSALAGADVAAATSGLLVAVPEDLLQDGGLDLTALGRLQAATATAAERTADARDDLSGLRTGFTPGVVAAGVGELQAEVRGTADALGRAAQAMAALDGVLGGDGERRLLLALQNNAELRGTGGLLTVFAEATARDGRLELTPFRDVETVADRRDDVRTVPAPSDYRRLYGGFLAGTTLWKNVNMSPDVPTSSAVLAEVAAASLDRRPDAVVWFDVPLIAAVLRATGPVQLPDGSTLDADNAVRRLLSEAYFTAPDTAEGQRVRRAQLRAAADAVLAGLLGREGGSPAALGRELARAVAGRHLALWSADPQEQAELARAGLDAAVDAPGGDLSALTVHNLGGGDDDGNKLDYYGRRQTTVSVVVHRDRAQVVQELALRNTAPTRGLPRYVAGGATPGVANLFVTLALPRGARDVLLDRDGQPVGLERLPEADHDVLTALVSLPPGASTSWRLTYDVPLEDGRYGLTLHPQPLAVDSGLALDVRSADGLRLRARTGPAVEDGRVAVSGPYGAVTEVVVAAEPPGVLGRVAHAVRRFWSRPVPLPWD